MLAVQIVASLDTNGHCKQRAQERSLAGHRINVELIVSWPLG